MPKRQIKRKPQRAPSQGPMWLVVGLFMGLGIAVLMNWEPVLKALNTAMNTPSSTSKTSQTAVKPKELKSKSNPSTPKKQNPQSPQFDFYDMLANNQKASNTKPAPAQKPVQPPANTPSPTVVNPTSNYAAPSTILSTPAPSAEASSPPPVNSSERYIIQIASLPDYREADRLKAELTMSGFEVHIHPYRKNNSTWYRVSTGPYATKQLAIAKQAELQRSNIVGILVKQ